MELVCPYCSAQVSGPPPDGVCPVCGESLTGIEPSIAEAPAAAPVPTDVGVVPSVAEEPDRTQASAPVAAIDESLPPAGEEASFVEDTVVSGTQLLPQEEPVAEPSWNAEAAVAAGVASALASATPAPKPIAMPRRESFPGIAEFLALVQNGTHANGAAASADTGARERECPSCHSRVFASADELCPNCGDLLDGSTAAPPVNGNEHGATAPVAVAAPPPAPAPAARAKSAAPEAPAAAPTRKAEAPPPAPARPSKTEAPSPMRAEAPPPVAPLRPSRAEAPSAVAALRPSRAEAPSPVAPLRPSRAEAPSPVTPLRPSRAEAPSPISARAQSRECPHCHTQVVAAPDELCPSCGDFLDSPSADAAAAAEVTHIEAPAPSTGPAMRECPHCKSRVFASADELCPECGDLLENAPIVEDSKAGPPIEEQVCAHCGASVIGTIASPCPSCGKILGETPVSIPTAAAAAAEMVAAKLRPAAVTAAPQPSLEESTFVGPGAAQPAAETKFCTSCAAEIPGDARSCPACGVRTDDAPPETAVAPALHPDDEKTVADMPPPPVKPNVNVAAPRPSKADTPSPISAADAEAQEPTVADELVLGVDPGTAERDERFPTPKVPRSREQISLPGRKKEPAKKDSKEAKEATPAKPVPAAPAAPATKSAPPWQEPDPVKIAPVRAVTAPPTAGPTAIGTARGAAVEPPAARRSGGMLLGVIAGTMVGAVGVVAVGVIALGIEIPGVTGGGDPTPEATVEATVTPPPETPVQTLAAATATPIATTTEVAPTPIAPVTPVGTPAIADPPATNTPAPTPAPIATVALAARTPTPPVVAPTPVIAPSTPVYTPAAATPTPVVAVRTPVPTATATPTLTPVAARTPVVVTPPPATPTPTPPPPATPAPTPTAVAAVDPRASSLMAAVGKVKSGDVDVVAQGIKALKKMVKEDPKYADAWFWLGFGHSRLQEDSETCDAMATYLELAPDGRYAEQARETDKQCD